MRFARQAAIVTGAAGGIGLACAKRLAAEGAWVILADVDAEKGAAAVKAIEAEGRAAYFVRTDVGDARQAGALIDAALEWAGRLDVLVNNAGILRSSDFLDLSEADFDAVIRVNLKGSFLVGQAAARAMAARGGGAIVNVSSINAVVALPQQTAYVTSKGGINQLTKTMALALAPHKIRVNAIGPGSIATEMVQQVMGDEAAKRTLMSRTPLGRLGTPDEVAAVVAFLASEDASYITGEILYADGGRLALNYTVPVAD